MKTEHTPGKWLPGDRRIQQAARAIVAYYEGEAWKWPTEEAFTDRTNEVAHLIAAAPELLAALTQARNELLSLTQVPVEYLDKAITKAEVGES